MVIIAIVTFISVLIIDISTIASFLLLLFNVFPVSHGTSLKVTNSFSLHRTISLFSCSAFRSSSERKNKLDHVCIFMFSFPDNFFFLGLILSPFIWPPIHLPVSSLPLLTSDPCQHFEKIVLILFAFEDKMVGSPARWLPL